MFLVHRERSNGKKAVRRQMLFLGMQAFKSTDVQLINQTKYSVDILAKFKMDKSNPVFNNIATEYELSRQDIDLISDHSMYRNLVGSP